MKTTFYSVLLIAVLGLTGCATSFHGHSDHNDSYADNSGKGGWSAALAKILGVEILPIKKGVTSTSDDHGITRAGGMLAKEKLTDFKAKTTNPNGVTREYGIGSKESDPDEEAIRAFNENPLFVGLSKGLQAYLSAGLSEVFGDEDLSDTQKLEKAIEVVEADEDAPEGAVDELKAKLEDVIVDET